MLTIQVGKKNMKTFRVTCNTAGHGGLRWRNKPLWFHMSSDSDFPKNGETVIGSVCDEFPGWVKVWDKPFWLPISDPHFNYLEPVNKA